jgi:hypothetical protein
MHTLWQLIQFSGILKVFHDTLHSLHVCTLLFITLQFSCIWILYCRTASVFNHTTNSCISVPSLSLTNVRYWNKENQKQNTLEVQLTPQEQTHSSAYTCVQEHAVRASAGWSDVGSVTATINWTERGFYKMSTKKLFENSTWCVYRIRTVWSNWFRTAKKLGRMCSGKRHQVSIPPQRKFFPGRQSNSSNSWLGEHVIQQAL